MNQIRNESATLYSLDEAVERHSAATINNGITIAEQGIINRAKEILLKSIKRGDTLCSPQQTRDFLMLELAKEQAEVFAVLFLDNRNRVISFDKMFFGTIDGASVYPREVIKRALHHNAAAVILAHNHPSGVAEPSHADEQITNRLKEGLALVDIRVLDHFIVGDEIVSFAERGLL